jgi:tetratricopeptide (TPR) repeat protein
MVACAAWADEGDILKQYEVAGPLERQNIVDKHSTACGWRTIGELALAEFDRAEQGPAITATQKSPADVTGELIVAGKRAQAQRLLRAVVSLGGPDEWRQQILTTYLWFALSHDQLKDEIAWWEKNSSNVDESWSRSVRARLHLAGGNVDAAAALAEEVHDDATLEAAAWWKGDYRIIATRPEAKPAPDRDLGTWGLLGGCSRVLGEGQELETAMQGVIDQGRDTGKHEAAGWILVAMDRPEDALKFYLDVGHLDEAFKLLFAQELYSDAFALIDGVSDEQNHRKVWTHVVAAQSYLKIGKRDQALQQLETGWKENEEHKDFSKALLIAQAEHDAGRTNESWEHLAQALEWTDAEKEPTRDTLDKLAGYQDVDWRRCWEYYSKAEPDLSTIEKLDRIRKLAEGKAGDELPKMIDAIEAEQAGVAAGAGLPQLVAKQMKTAGDPAGAVKYLENWQKKIDKIELLWPLAQWAAEQKHWDRAAEIYEQIWHKEPANAKPLILRAWALEQGGKKQESQDAADMALAITRPADQDDIYDEFESHGMANHARRLRDQVLKITSMALIEGNAMAWRRGEDALAQNNPLEAAQWYDKALVGMCQNTFWYSDVAEFLSRQAQLHWARAKGLIKSGDVQHALAEVKDGLRLNPAADDPIIDLVKELRQAGAAQEANQIAQDAFAQRERACQFAPDYAQGHNSCAWIGGCCAIELDKSLAHARRAVELSPKNASIWDTLAQVLSEMGNADEAIEAERKAIALDPEMSALKEQLKKFEKRKQDSQPKK